MYTNRYYTILVLYVTGIDEYVYWLINIVVLFLLFIRGYNQMACISMTFRILCSIGAYIGHSL